MRHWCALLVCSAALIWPLFQTTAQDHPDVVIFDEDDPIGTGYYDASVAIAVLPSKMVLDGPGDKMIIVTNQAFSGKVSGLLQWQSAVNGDWKLFIAPPGFKTANASGYSNLVLYLNGPKQVRAADLPRVGLESSPPDISSSTIALGDFLPEGVDADTNTWQKITIPLSAIPPKNGFSLSRLKDVFFAQNAADGAAHALWVDNIRITSGAQSATNQPPPAAPAQVVALAGDGSIILHWARNPERDLAGYNIYRAPAPGNAMDKVNPAPVAIQGYADVDVTNGQTYVYTVLAVNNAGQESQSSAAVNATPQPFPGDNEFLEYVQHAAFDYFWYEANPSTGMIRDRSDPSAAASIAAVGFGLTAIGIGVDHGWIGRPEGAQRTLTTLRSFWEKPQGTNVTGTTGYKGWFYHALDMDTGLRSGTTELSSIDTALLLAGILYSRQYFSGVDTNEVAIRTLASSLFDRVDWSWMSRGGSSLSMGWRPESGFIQNQWIGYNEGSLLYLLGFGAATNALPGADWSTWTSGYQWQTNYGQAFVSFPPLFGHQYAQCWVDLRHETDAYLRNKGLTYFENSRRATLAQRQYAMANPLQHTGYSSNLWGWTACDGPGVAPYQAYSARGTPPAQNDDGTIAPTAAGGSLPFAPEFSLPALRFMYDQYRTNLWTAYGFADAFNLQANWWDSQVIGIDQGPILLMAENFRSGRVWQLFMRNPEIQRGLAQAGFVRGQFLPVALHGSKNGSPYSLSWQGSATGIYWVEVSNDLVNWVISPSTPPTVLLSSPSPVTYTWNDPGAPASLNAWFGVSWRFYRVFQIP